MKYKSIVRHMSIAAVSASVFGQVASAAPDVTVTSVTQTPTRSVLVSYDLAGEDAVVTLDVQTNTLADASGDWVSIGPENVRYASGDVNRKVAAGTGRTIRWSARRSWPDQNIPTPTVRAVVKAWPLDDPPDYMVVDLLGSKNVRYYEDVRQLPAKNGIDDDLYRTSELVMRRVHATNVEWYMGSPTSELGRDATNWDAPETRHAVTLTKDYYLGVFELTGRQYANVGGGKAVAEDEDTLPLMGVSWNSMRGSCLWPDALHEVTAGGLKLFRDKTGISTWDLPTEAQWEFACRAGTTSALYTGEELEATDVSARLDALAWYKANADDVRHRVGEKQPNAWGFYDMLGNVSEFCLDWFDLDLGTASVTDPIGPTEGSCRAVRGGRFNRDALECRSAARENWMKPDDAKNYLGFRLACDCRAE